MSKPSGIPRAALTAAVMLAGLAPSGTRAQSGALVRSINNPIARELTDYAESMAVAGNFIVIGAPNEAIGQGAVYIYEGMFGQLVEKFSAPLPNPPVEDPPDDEYGAKFGTGVAARFDGRSLTIVAGAPGEGTAREGGFGIDVQAAAYLIRNGKIVARMTSPDNPGANFGSSIALTPNYIYIAETNDAFYPEGFRTNKINVYSAANGTFLTSIANPDDAPSGFGRPLAAMGDNVVAGASYYTDENFNRVGRAHLFGPAGGAPLRTFDYPLAPETFVYFGGAIAVAADRIFIGRGYTTQPGIGRVFGFDASGQLLTTLHHPNETEDVRFFGESLGAGEDHVLVGFPSPGVSGVPSVLVYDAKTTGDVNAPVLTLDRPNTHCSAYSGFGLSLGAMPDGSLVVSSPAHLTCPPDSRTGAVHVFQGLGSSLEYEDRSFTVDTESSLFRIAVAAGEGGPSMNFSPRGGGRVIYRIYHREGRIVAMQLLQADLTADDLATTFPFPIELRGLRAILGGSRGAAGPPGAMAPDGAFNQFGIMMEFDGFARVKVGNDEYTMEGGSGAGQLPVALPGILRALSPPAGGKALPAEFAIDMALSMTRVVANGSGAFNPVIQVTSEATLHQQPGPLGPSFQELLDYLLGKGEAKPEFDVNADGRTDNADLALIRILFYQVFGAKGKAGRAE